jgi:hypothetical protein
MPKKAFHASDVDSDVEARRAKERVKRAPRDIMSEGSTSPPRKPTAIERPPVKISETKSEGEYNWQSWTGDEVKQLKELEKGYKGSYGK